MSSLFLCRCSFGISLGLAGINYALCVVNQLLEKIFSESAKHWMSAKIHMKAKQDHASQQYKFRARAFKLESIIELNISSLEKSLANESFSEWKDFLAEEVLVLFVYVFKEFCLNVPCFLPFLFFHKNSGGSFEGTRELRGRTELYRGCLCERCS